MEQTTQKRVLASSDIVGIFTINEIIICISKIVYTAVTAITEFIIS